MYHLAICVAIAAAGLTHLDLPWYAVVAGGGAAYLITGGWKFIRLFYLTFGRDVGLIRLFFGIDRFVVNLAKENKIAADIFTETAMKYPDKAAFVSAETGKTLTYKEAEEMINKIANAFAKAGYQKGDVVGLLMENCIEYVPIWLGLTKIGVIVALLNVNLRGDSLKHCINMADCEAIIYKPTMKNILAEITNSGLKEMKYYIFGENIGMLDETQGPKLFQSASNSQPLRPVPLSVTDKMLYIYTSGTTGLPKASIIRGTRFTFMSYGVSATMRCSSSDVFYNTLPLYHSSGSLSCAGPPFYTGATCVIRKKFSASRFFEDCNKYNVTIFNYIGETCRYLLATPPGEYDRKHRVRIAMGNGLRNPIWEGFKDRFAIPKIVEMYGATEGNANMMNNVDKVGAVGYNSVIAPWFYPIKLIRCDMETGEILRGSDGMAVSCKTGELGQMVGKVMNDPMHKFDGYVDQQATKKKIAHDIFKKGDSAFMSGDVLYQDELGFYFFQDRTGDTFRWKGENVSTNEVEGVMSKVLKLNDVCVYGVEVPGVEGKAGMAVISDPQQKVDIEGLHCLISKSLPPYACPVFVRVTPNELEKTTTFKFKKNKLREEGFDTTRCPANGDLLFYFDGELKKYLRLDSEVFTNIKKRALRF